MKRIFGLAGFLILFECLSGAALIYFAYNDLSETENSSSRNPASQDSADLEAGISEFQELLQTKASNISNANHFPRLHHHGRKTEYSVVLMHGLYMSPATMQAVTQNFYNQGFNVVCILLAGHWTKRPEDLDQTSFKEWIADRDQGISIARKIGKKMLLAGYSTGGVLAIDAALDPANEIQGVFAWAPALALSGRVTAGSSLGSLFSISGNKHFNIPPDGLEIPYFSPQAGIQVQKLIDQFLGKYAPAHLRYFNNEATKEDARRRTVYESFNLPLFLVDTEIDDVISARENARFFKFAQGPKKHIVYTKEQQVTHDDIAKGRADATRRIPWHNPYLPGTLSEMNRFISERFPNR